MPVNTEGESTEQSTVVTISSVPITRVVTKPECKRYDRSVLFADNFVVVVF